MISALQDTFLLNDGTSIPGFGFGCWGAIGNTIKSAVEFALNSGYLSCTNSSALACAEGTCSYP